MSILDSMRNTLASTAVKFMGSEAAIPEMEFVMHPHRKQDAVHEARINDPEMVMHGDGSWTFRGVPIREEMEQSTWALSPVRKPDFCEACAGAVETCDCAEPRHIVTATS